MTSPDPLAQALAGAAVAVVRPGDTLVIGLNDGLWGDDAEKFVGAIREHLPENVNPVVIEGCVHLAVLRPEPAE